MRVKPVDPDILYGWEMGYKRSFDGEVYLTRRERNRAYQQWLKEKKEEAWTSSS